MSAVLADSDVRVIYNVLTRKSGFESVSNDRHSGNELLCVL